MADCLDLLEIRRHTDIIKNVVQFGLLRQTDTVLEKLAGAAPHAANERKD
jgi:hypothetical protein